MNSYKCTNGERVSQSVIERNIRKAKDLKHAYFLRQHTHVFCEFTKVNASADIIDTMHIISVDQCKKMGKTELCWSQSNLRYGARTFHEKFDNKSHKERVMVFEELNDCKL
jgi:hypothetical protein